MGFIGQLAEKRDSLEELVLKDPARWLLSAWVGESSEAGIAVNERTAMACSTVYACVQILADTVASLPLFVYERLQEGGRRKAIEHPLFSLLHDEWNEEMSSFTARETMQAHLATWGNSYAYLDWNRSGRLNGIWPLRPDWMEVKRDTSGAIVYLYQDAAGKRTPYRPENILHVRGLGFDGLKGYSVIRMAKDAIGLALATEQAGSKLFANGIQPSGVLEHPHHLSADAIKNLQNSLGASHGGSSRFKKPMVLEEGMKWTAIGIPPEDAQFLQSRKFQAAEIARFYRMQLHKIQEMDAATFSNIEHQAIEFVVDTIRPWLIRTEQEYRRKLLPPADRGRFYIEHLVDGLLRGDIKTRYEAYAIGRGNTWLSANDVRELENMNPIGPQGDVYHVPLNWMPADQADPGTPPDPARARRALPEFAEHRSLGERRRARESHRRIFRDAAGRIVAREAKAVRGQLAGLRRRQSPEDLVAWLDEYYRSFGSTAADLIYPAVDSLGRQIHAIAAQEVGADEVLPPEVERFFRDYADAMGARHAGFSRSQLEALIRDNQADLEAAVAAVEQRLLEWEEKRPDKIAGRETVRAESAIAKVAWIAAGVTLLRWVAFGQTCPLCQELDGAVVGVEKNFVNEGETLNPGGTAPLTSRGPVGHPPAHGGCDCSIVPG